MRDTVVDQACEPDDLLHKSTTHRRKTLRTEATTETWSHKLCYAFLSFSSHTIRILEPLLPLLLRRPPTKPSRHDLTSRHPTEPNALTTSRHAARLGLYLPLYLLRLTCAEDFWRLTTRKLLRLACSCLSSLTLDMAFSSALHSLTLFLSHLLVGLLVIVLS